MQAGITYFFFSRQEQFGDWSEINSFLGILLSKCRVLEHVVSRLYVPRQHGMIWYGAYGLV